MIIILLGLLLRLCVSLHGYSGQNKPPMFGDYEAQRHWMEITYNLPVREWYFNTTDNDLMYWGLDYPPLTAYHSLVCGYIAAFVNQSYVQLHHSRGYESENHKQFMRLTVIVADLLTFIPALMLFYFQNIGRYSFKGKDFSTSNNEVIKLCCLLGLLYPGIIIIDHGHFQYNCVSLGLFVLSVTAVTLKRHLVASILFCCALLYKQMELYHALPFFFYLLGNCFQTFKKYGFITSASQLIKLGSVVITTLLVVCFPFVIHSDQLVQLMIRLFPIARGVFEDKVANVWCVVNLIYKLKVLLSNESMAKVCLISTGLAVIPSCYNVFINNSVLKFKYALVNSALAFFLFSYQVHEKSILLAATPVLLILPNDPLASSWFLFISIFSLLPLLLKDQLLLPYCALSIIFILTFITSSFNKHNERLAACIEHSFPLVKEQVFLLFYPSLIGCIFLTVFSAVMSPPKRYPDIFPLLISIYSCFHFLAFFVYFNLRQWTANEIIRRNANS